MPPVRGEGETLSVGKGIKPVDNTPAPRKLSEEEIAAQEEQRKAAKGNKAGHTHSYFDQWDSFDVVRNP